MKIILNDGIEIDQVPQFDDKTTALELVLLFYSINNWDTLLNIAWTNRLGKLGITNNFNVTSKNLCDAIRMEGK